MKLSPSLFVTALFLFIASFSVAQKAEMIKMEGLQKIMNTPTSSVKVINFWATWCAPCIKELPFFEKVNQENKNVKVTLVSMDYDLDPNPDKVNRFIQRKKIQSEVVILAEKDPNSWIEKVDKDWSGAIPSTLIINPANGKRKFIQKELTQEELEKLILEIAN